MRELLSTLRARIQKWLPLPQIGAVDVHPTRDWVVLLCVAGMLMSGLFTVGAYEYFYAAQELASVDVYETQEVGFDEKVWDSVVGAYRIRTATFESLRTAPEQYPLPNARADRVVVPSVPEESLSEEVPETEGVVPTDENLPAPEL